MITSVTPVSGRVGDMVTVNGSGFNMVASQNRVRVGGVEYAVQSGSATQLVVSVPARGGAGAVEVTDLSTGARAQSREYFLPSYVGSGFVSAASLEPSQSYSSNGIRAVATGDLDGDGRPEVVVGSDQGQSIQVFLNQISGPGPLDGNSLVGQPPVSVGWSVYAVKLADVDGDGKEDVVIGGSGGIRIYRNTSTLGAISFDATPVNLSAVSGVINQVAVGDMDGDGRMDVVGAEYVSSSAGYVVMYQNLSPGVGWPQSFGSQVSFTTTQGLTDIRLADMDGNQRPEVWVTGGNLARAYPNTGATTGGIWDVTILDIATNWSLGAPNVSGNAGGLALWDIDGDGKLDMAQASRNDNTLKVIRNAASPGLLFSFPGVSASTGSGVPYSVAMGDIDGDGKADAVVGSENGNLLLLKNTSTVGTISYQPVASVTAAAGTKLRSIAVADLDGDGQAEVVWGNNSSNELLVWRNAVILAPTVSGINPVKGGPGTQITITGTNFRGVTPVAQATGVAFLGSPTTALQSFTVVSATQIVGTVAGGATGAVQVTTPNGVAAGATFQFFPRPVVSGFSPAVAGPGLVVTITGQHFNEITNVKLGGTDAASYVVVDSMTIQATVAGGATGVISVSGTGGTASSLTNFTFQPTPTISGFNPAIAGPGMQVTITGTTLQNVQSVSFGGTAAASFINPDANTIVATIAAGSTGVVQVTTAGGTATSVGNFTFQPTPTISGFNPTIAGPGLTVTISGTNFQNVLAVNFGGTAAASFTNPNASTIIATVAAGTSGNVQVVTAGGNATSVANFTFQPAPIITGFSPSIATPVQSLTVTGSNLQNISQVKVGIGIITSYISPNANTVILRLSTATSGNIFISTSGGSVTSAGSVQMVAQPMITSVTPVSGRVGDMVTVNGSGFNMVASQNRVRVGGVEYAVQSGSATQLVVSVPARGGAGAVEVTDLSTGARAQSREYFLPSYVGSGFVSAASLEPSQSYSSNGIRAVATGDLDGDGRPEVVVGSDQGQSIQVFLNQISGPGPLDGNSLVGQPPVSVGWSVYAVKLADVDGDGKEDVVIGGSGGIRIYRNTSTLGAISFDATPVNLSAVSGVINQVAVGDMDGDGRMDVVGAEYVSSSAGYVVMYQNLSPGVGWPQSFGSQVSFTTTQGLTDIRLADMDGNQRPEVWVTGGNLARAYPNTGATTGGIWDVTILDIATNWSLGAPNVSGNAGGLALWDIDGDGKLDMAQASRNDNTLKVIRNAASPGLLFSFPGVSASTGSGVPYSVAMGDIDGDGKADAVVGSENGNLLLLKNTSTVGTISYQPVASVTAAAGTKLRSIAVADLDGDGQAEVVWGNNSSNELLVWRNAVILAPTVSGINPVKGGPGTQITITGTNFRGVTPVAQATGVAFLGSPTTALQSFTVVSATQIVGTVAGGATGAVQVTTPNGVAAGATFQFFPRPVVSGFSPAVAGPGLVVTITGQHFNEITNVKLGGTDAASYVVVDSMTIQATVAGGATGVISVSGTGGTASSLTNFTFQPTPTISGFNIPNSLTGTTVTINGQSFGAIASVRFGGVNATSFLRIDSTQITAILPTTSPGSITVQTAGGTANVNIAAPSITGFNPSQGAGPGATVTINGNNFIGVNSVVFNGANATSYTVVNNTTITAVVPVTTTGPLTVTAFGGTGNRVFAFRPPPTITGFLYPNPPGAVRGEAVTITGTNLNNVQTVNFGGTNATTITQFIGDSTRVAVVVVGSGNFTNVSLTTWGGSASINTFEFYDVPTITTFSPTTNVFPGTTVTISGTNFIQGGTNIQFGTTPARSVNVASRTSLTAVVDFGATGNIQVSTRAGNSLSANQFIFSFPPPTVTSFSPARVRLGSILTITGTQLDYSPVVTVGGVPATVVGGVSNTQITVEVGTGVAGTLPVCVRNASVSSPAPVCVTGVDYIPLPTITSISPASAPEGATVTITGTALALTDQVFFNGVQARDFTVINNTTITAVVSNAVNAGPIPVTVSTFGGQVTDNALFSFLFNAPTFTSFSPTSAQALQRVTINGTNLGAIQQASFGGRNAKQVLSVSNLQAIAIVDTGSLGGNVCITMRNGTQLCLPSFTYLTPAPVATNFTPKVGGQNARVTVTGSNIGSASAITFGGTRAASIIPLSTDSVVAILANGSTGPVTVITRFGNSTVPTQIFNFADVPRITSFTPTTAGEDDIVTIRGNRFIGSSYTVTFGGKPAKNVVVVDTNTLSVTVGAGGTGSVAMSGINGSSAPVPGFTYLYKAPQLFSFAPATGAPRNSQGVPTDTITLTGRYMTDVISVTIGGNRARIYPTPNLTSILKITPGDSGSTGPICVRTPGGSVCAAGTFTWQYPVPSISGFVRDTAGTGSTVVISGFNLVGTSVVSLGGTPALSYTVVDSNTINAVVASGSSGNVFLQTPGGTASRAGFTYVLGPTITSVTPTSGTPGTVVTITGTRLRSTRSVNIAGSRALNYQIIDDNTITATVFLGGNTDIVSVNTLGGAASISGFNFTFPGPTITSLQPNPTRVGNGDILTINGTQFWGVQSVQLGNVIVPLDSITVTNPNTILVRVRNVSSGFVTVTTPGGNATVGGFVYVPVPTITSFAPTRGRVGGLLTIRGANLNPPGGILALSIGNVSHLGRIQSAADDNLIVQIDTARSGSVLVRTIGGTARLAGFELVPPPVITIVSPTRAEIGRDSITILGVNLSEASVVQFGPTAFARLGTDFTQANNTPTSVKVRVPRIAPLGSAIFVSVTTPGGTAESPIPITLFSSISGTDVTDLASVIKVFPNPVVDILNVTGRIVPSSNQIQFVISSFDGRDIIIEEFVASESSLAKQFNLGDLPRGVYILTVVYGRRKATWKFIKI
jgi:hypothetical protein